MNLKLEPVLKMNRIDKQELTARIGRVQENIAEAARSAGRSPSEVTLVGVSKTHPPELIAAAYECGLRVFGENRVQEATEKIALLRPQLPGARWHLIGHLQTNKARDAVELFDMIESVDSLRLAEALNRRSTKRLPVLIEVNLSGEASKGGFLPTEPPAGIRFEPGVQGDSLRDSLPKLLALPNLEVQGLMTIAPLIADRAASQHAARIVFRALRSLLNDIQHDYPLPALRELSMGMSDDYAIAIEEGATIVRVGRALFGERTI